MKTIDYFAEKFNIDLNQPSPIEIPNINRRIMAQSLAELGFIVGAEVGVAAGDHSVILAENIPGHTLYCIDAWSNHGGYYQFRGQRLREWRELAYSRLAPHNCTIIEKFSMEAIGMFPNQSLDFVYIDAAHDFKNIAMDICEWIKKVKPDGILYGHDYTTISFGRSACHVKHVVDAYVASHLIEKLFILGMTGKPDGMYREGEQSWMIIC